jgi:quinol monooxygenase YgiN
MWLAAGFPGASSGSLVRYDAGVRTTLTLEDDLTKAREAPPPVRVFRLDPVSLGEPRGGYDLTMALELADAIEFGCPIYSATATSGGSAGSRSTIRLVEVPSAPTITRRQLIGAAAVGVVAIALPTRAIHTGANTMYGLIGKIKAVPGQRDALVSILLEGTSEMLGCLSYIVASDSSDADAIWITEVWDSQESHRASLALPSVREAITRGKPLIAAFEQFTETRPVGGHGLPASES